MRDTRTIRAPARRVAVLTATGIALAGALSAQSAGGSAEAASAPKDARPLITDLHKGAPASASSRKPAARLGNDGRARTAWRSRGEARPWWQVDLGREVRVRNVRINWAGRARPKAVQLLVSRDGTRFRPIGTPRAGRARLHGGRSKAGRYVRLRMVTTRGRPVGISEVKIRSRVKTAELAAKRPVRASSARSRAARGNDGRRSTRWVSRRGARHWWQVDLGRRLSLNAVRVQWGGARPRNYVLRVSNDGRHFRSVGVRRSGRAGWQRTGFSSIRARFVRVVARSRGPRRPIALHELQAFGPAGRSTEARSDAGQAPLSQEAPRATTELLSTPSPAGSPEPAVVPTRPLDVGLAAGGNLQYLDGSALDQRLDLAASLGVRWVRFDIHWSQVQAAGPSAFDWGPTDRLVAKLRDRGLTPLPMIGYTPMWARPASCTGSDKCPPADVDDYADFAHAAVSRYAPQGVSHWEIWNEPNLSNYWLPRPDPAKYTSLLVAATQQIRQVQPTATVVSAGLSPYGAPGDQTTTRMNPVTFLERMYTAGARGSFDALGMHPYNHPDPPSPGHPAAAWTQLETSSPSLRSVMSANGDAGLKIWATEFGYPTCQSASNCVSEGAQAQFTGDAISAWHTFDWAGPLMMFQLVDSGTADEAESRFGFFRSDLSEKPSASIVRSQLLSTSGHEPGEVHPDS